MAGSPRLLIADEPTAHLDRPTGRHVIELLLRAARETGITVLASSHDDDVLAAADEVVPLDHRR
jgi:putative ABC transport system ATP-binding protein